jgi:two-component system, OmpR family, sensor kinase
VSIRLRLALWYGGLFAIVLFLFGLYGYAFHARGNYDDIDRVLVTSAGHAAAESSAMQGEPHLLAGSGGFQVALRLYSPDGQVREASSSGKHVPSTDPRAVLRSPGGPAFDPVAGLAPALAAPTAPHGAAFGTLMVDGQRWRVYVQPLSAQSGLIGFIEALTPLGQVDRSIQTFRLVLLLLGLTGLTAALAAGWAVAARALRPIDRMVSTAHTITLSRDLSARIELPRRDDELAHLAHTFNAMLKSLEVAARAQRRFVSDASHELRAPLTAIQANLELLRRHPEMPLEERGEALGEAEREASRLTRLVADLLALAQADVGLPVAHKLVDLDLVVLDAFRAAQPLVRGQALTLDPFEPVQVEGDADRLKQLLLILLDNAIKYTPAGGAIGVGLRQTDHGAEVVVRDSGVGIAPADLPHVFERFYRADPARGRDPGGTGLGLPIARWIADQHSATISIDSQPERGTRVTARLPRAVGCHILSFPSAFPQTAEP